MVSERMGSEWGMVRRGRGRGRSPKDGWQRRLARKVDKEGWQGKRGVKGHEGRKRLNEYTQRRRPAKTEATDGPNADEATQDF